MKLGEKKTDVTSAFNVMLDHGFLVCKIILQRENTIYYFCPVPAVLFRLAVVRFSSGSGTFWLNPNLKYQVRSSGQPNPEPEPLEPGLKGLNSVWTSSNLQLNKPNFSFFYLFSFSVFSWCHTVTEPNWLTYIFISSQPALSFHSHSHTTSKVIVFITN